MSKVNRKAAVKPKTHAARSRPGAKSKPRKASRRKNLGWFARQKQKVADFRDRILSYRIHALVGGGLLAAVTVYGALAAGVGEWVADEVGDASRHALIASGLSVEQIRVEGRNRADLEEVRPAKCVEAIHARFLCEQLQHSFERHFPWCGDREPEVVGVIAEIIVAHSRVRADDFRDCFDALLRDRTGCERALVTEQIPLEHRGDLAQDFLALEFAQLLDH